MLRNDVFDLCKGRHPRWGMRCERYHTSRPAAVSPVSPGTSMVNGGGSL